MNAWPYGRRVSVPALVLCLLSGVLLGAGAYTVRYAEGLSYLSTNPKSCVNCHIMREQFDGWQHAERDAGHDALHRTVAAAWSWGRVDGSGGRDDKTRREG